MAGEQPNAEEMLLDDLLIKWFDAAAPKPTCEELCSEQPSLVEKLQQRIKPYLALEEFRQSGEDNGDSAEHWPEVPNHELLCVVGRGGMGRVFKARQLSTGRVVAVKLLAGGEGSTEMLRRFKQEIALASLINHPGVVPIVDAGNARGALGPIPFFSMEFVDGLPLHQFVTRGSLSLQQKIQLLIEICDAVSAVHSLKLVHRDLKPSNILVTADGHPKLLDFGVARAMESSATNETMHTATGQFIGTRQYASPEQLTGFNKDVDARADVHALGLIAYEVLAGRRPYEIDNLSADRAVKTICDEEPTSISRFDRHVRGDLETIVMKALSKDRERRYTDAAKLRDDLIRYSRGERILGRPDSTWYRAKVFTRKNRALVTSLTIIMLSLIAALLFMSYQKRQVASVLRERQLQLADQLAEKGILSADHGDPATALLYIARAVDLSTGDGQRERENRIRYTTTKAMIPHLVSDEGTLPTYDNGRILLDPRIKLEKPTDGNELTGYNVHIVDAARGIDVKIPGFSPLPYWMEISPDGSRFAAADRGHFIRLYELPSGRKIREEKFILDTWVATFSPDSQLLVSSEWTDGVYGWSARTGDDAWPALTKPRSGITSVTFSPNGQRIAILWDGGVIEQVDLQTRRPVAPPIRTNRRFLCMAYSADGSRIAVGCADGAAMVFDADDTEYPITVAHHNQPIGRVSFAGDQLITVTGRFDAIQYRPSMIPIGVHRWSLTKSIPPKDVLYERWPSDQAWLRTDAGVLKLPDTSLIVTKLDEQTRIDSRTGNVLARFKHSAGGLRPANTTTMGSYFRPFVDDTERIMRVMDWRTAQFVSPDIALLGTYRFGEADVNGRFIVAMSRLSRSEPHAKQYAQAFMPDSREIGLMEVFDIATGAPMFDPIAFRYFDTDMALSPSGKLIATCDAEGKCQLWDAHTGQRVRELPRHAARAFTPAFSPDESVVITFSFSGTAYICSLRDPSDVIKVELGAEGRSVTMSPDSSLAAIPNEFGRVIIWDLKRRCLNCAPVEFGARTSLVRFSHDGQIAACTTNTRGLRMFSTRDGSFLSPIRPDVRDCQFLPGEDEVVMETAQRGYRFDFRPAVGAVAELVSDAEQLSGHRLDSSNSIIEDR